MFRKVRWPETDGEPVCSKCGGLDAYEYRRETGALCFECRACKAHFSITSGTLFANHKLPLRTYLAAIAIFCNEVKGKSALAISRDLGVSYKACFVLLHKMREAMAEEMRGRTVGGDGKVAEIDGGYFGGYVKPANYREHRRDRRLWQNQSGKRECVVIVRERNGNSVPAVFRYGRPSPLMDQEAHSARNGRECRRSGVMGRIEQALRNEAHQPPGRL